jgi:hypothetical protein
MIFHCWHNKRIILTSLAIAVVSLGVILLPFILIARDQYIFGTVTYNYRTINFWVEFGLMGLPDLINRIYHVFLVSTEMARIFYAAATILLLLAGYVVWKITYKHARLKEVAARHEKLIFLLIFILIFEIFCGLNYLAWAGLRMFTFPAAAVLAGVGISRVLEQIGDRSAVWLVNGLVIALIIVTPFAQYGQRGEAQPAVRWSASDVKYIYDVSQRVAAETKPGDTVLTLTPPLALQADRNLMPGMNMELLGFFPTWDTAKVEKYHLLNEALLLGYISSKKAGAVVLDENRFFRDIGQAVIFDKYRQEILKTLNDNYYLAETIPYPDTTARGTVYIYLPRRP